MRKLLALVLVSALLLSAVPAFALELLSGGDTYPLKTDKAVSWYAETALIPHEKFVDASQSPFHIGLSELTGVKINWSFPPAGTAGNVFTNTLLADPANLPNIMYGAFMNDSSLYLEDEMIWDITPYIQEYAPAYYAFLQSNPAYDRAMKTD